MLICKLGIWLLVDDARVDLLDIHVWRVL
jgi:hypothetical protein